MTGRFRDRIPVAAAAVAAGLGVAWLGRHRSSAVVRGWSPPLAGTRSTIGSLRVRQAGRGDQAIVLLHGLVTSGDAWGQGYDRLSYKQRLIVPDLLGFGGSLDTERSDFSLVAHLDARRCRLGGRSLRRFDGCHR